MTPQNAATAQLRVLLVDDEPPARRRMKAMLAERQDVTVVAEAAHGGQAIDLLRGGEVDIVLLDIQLPVATGIEVVEAVGVDRMPFVIFVTAYDEYAVRAFEVNAVDYLLKPVDPERLGLALDRAGLRHRDRNAANDDLRNAIEALRQQRVVHRIPVSERGRFRFVNLKDVDYMVAEGNYVRLRTPGESYLIRETLSALEERYADCGFLRIHRALLVQTDRIAELVPDIHGAYSVRLKDGTRLTSGRTYRDRIRRRLSLAD